MSIQNVESAFQEIARYDDPLDLADALVDLQKLGSGIRFSTGYSFM
jgi:hypothetical protein